MAFAVEQSDTQVLLFFVLPIKMKWLGILDGIIFGVTIVGGFMVTILPETVWYGLYNMGLLAGSVYYCYVNATCALVSMLNFLVFLLITFKKPARTATQRNYQKMQKMAKKAQKNQQRPSFNEKFYNANSEKSTWESANKPYINRGGAKHQCAVCKRTEFDDDSLVFRYCSKCVGGKEYCNEHLYTHIHVK